MSYTIPNYVDTDAQAIVAVASAVKGEAVTAANGTVHAALDALADALAEADVTIPQTNNGAILALAQYVSGGGGGGAQTVDVWLWNSSGPDAASVVPDAFYYEYVGGEWAQVTLTTEAVTADYSGTTVYGVKMKDVPVGAPFGISKTGYTVTSAPVIDYSETEFPPSQNAFSSSVLPPADGYVQSGTFTLLKVQ